MPQSQTLSLQPNAQPKDRLYRWLEGAEIRVREFRRYPWVLPLLASLCLFGWVALGAQAFLSSGHAHHHQQGISSLLINSQLMIVAMMTPMFIPVVLHIVRSVNPSQRFIAVGVALVTYSVLWVLPCVGLTLVYDAAKQNWPTISGFSPYLAPAVLVSCWWVGRRNSVIAIKTRCSQFLPVHVIGALFYISLVRCTANAWSRCVIECGLVMLSMLLLQSHSLLIMLAMTAILIADRYAVLNQLRSVSWHWLILSVAVLTFQSF